MNTKKLQIILENGIKHHRNGNLVLAEKNYRECIKFDTKNILALKNLALIEKNRSNLKEAKKLFQKVIDLGHQDAIFFNNYANLLRIEGEINEAVFYYQKSIAKDQNLMEPLQNLALLMANIGNYNEAKKIIDQIEKKIKLSIDLLILSGQVHALLGEKELAIEIYSKALLEEPSNIKIFNLRATELFALGRLEEAKSDYERIIYFDESNEEARYALAALDKRTIIEIAPKNYVSNLFDAYSQNFEEHLIKTLNYQTPNILFNQFRKIKSNKKYNALDLGCGTGLSAIAFQDAIKTIDGVDLSSGMLEKAKEKNLYDTLVCDDILQFMQNCKKKYDLVICADVLVYIGALEGFFDGLTKVLERNSYACISIEETPSDTFELKPSRRYGHSINYINNLAQKYDLIILDINQTFLRKEGKEEILGNVILLQTKSE